ncbi:osmoprotectant ABC transporter substrate-binding protein [Lentibacillus lipolyticus]|nr:osmoprotectant ABC transporter substrate-binding protein [Lentibacillus lipolyticus]
MKKNLIVIVSLLFLTLLISACSGGNTLTVGTQTYSETKTIGFMYKHLIEDNTDLSVNVKTDMSTDTLVLEGMMNDEIDIATTYTGTALTSFFSMKHPKDREKTMEQTKNQFAEEYNIKVLDPLGFANTYSLAVREDFAKKHNLSSISDLKDMASDLNFGSDTSWLERQGDDGYKAFKELYNFEFGETSPMSPNLVYDALNEKDKNIVLAYSTDARIDVYDLKTLNDDKNFFPPYDAATFVREESLDEYPELEELLNKFVGKLDLDVIRELNRKVDIDGKNPKDVAEQFLKDENLLK